MPNCTKCGQPLKEGAEFCAQCGAAVKHCPKCGQPLKEGAVFCAQCGAAVKCCLTCGQPLKEGAAFCARCGAAVNTVFPDSGAGIFASATATAPKVTIKSEADVYAASKNPRFVISIHKSMQRFYKAGAVVLIALVVCGFLLGRNNGHTFRSLWILVVVVVYVVGYRAIRKGIEMRRKHRTRDWPTAAGAVADLKAEFKPGSRYQSDWWRVEFVFNYAVNGKAYSGKYLLRPVTTEDFVRAACARLSQGLMTVHYNPQNAGDAVLWYDEVWALWSG